MIETKLVAPDECQKKLSVPGTKVHESQVCAFRSRGRGVCSVRFSHVQSFLPSNSRIVTKKSHSFFYFICQGDSGGPLAADGKLVGIVSWGDGDFCGDGLPEVYTNVYKFKDYIENIMKGFRLN